MARITVITPYYYPDIAANVPIIGSLCEDLVKSGHQVRVLTNYPGRISLEQKRKFIKIRKKMEIQFGARVFRCPNPFVGRQGVFTRISEYILFWIWVFFVAFYFSFKSDVFFVQSTPPFTNLLIIGKKIPVIYNLQDVFPASAVNSGVIKINWFLNIFSFFERKTYEQASVVTVISDSFLQHVHDVSSVALPILLPNWIDINKIAYCNQENNQFVLENDLGDKFVVLYAGNIGYNQDIETVINAAEHFQNNNEILFVIVGDGQRKQEMTEIVRNRKIKNVRFFPFQSEEKVAQVYSSCNIALITMKPGTLQSSVPSKTWTIMATERPIVGCIDQESELAEVILSTNAGLVGEPGNVCELIRNIECLYNHPNERMEYGSNGRKYVEENLSRDTITKEYNRLINRLTQIPIDHSRSQQ